MVAICAKPEVPETTARATGRGTQKIGYALLEIIVPERSSPKEGTAGLQQRET
jgi:hypothetical protein